MTMKAKPTITLIRPFRTAVWFQGCKLHCCADFFQYSLGNTIISILLMSRICCCKNSFAKFAQNLCHDRRPSNVIFWIYAFWWRMIFDSELMRKQVHQSKLLRIRVVFIRAYSRHSRAEIHAGAVRDCGDSPSAVNGYELIDPKHTTSGA